MKRAIILSLGVLLSMGVVLPLTTNWSEASSSKPAKRKKLRKYSRSWWRQYRAKQRRARLVAARRRASLESRGNVMGTRRAAPLAQPLMPVNSALGTAFDAATPAGWSRQAVVGSSDTEYRVADSVSGQPLGTAQLSVVGTASADDGGATENARSKVLGGIPLTTLRRQVIDRMVREEGWIVNDYQREVAGRRVFVVEAQTSKGGAVSSRRFYFTEVDGRIYSLATDSPTDFSDRLAADSEKLLTDLHQRNSQNNRTDTAATTVLRP